VASLAKRLSRELESEDICVNNLSPGTINTDRLWQIYSKRRPTELVNL